MLKRYSYEESLSLLNNSDTLEMGILANGVRNKLHPDNIVTYVIDRNINYTNVCDCKCKFCAFYRDKDHSEAYVLDYDGLSKKIEDTIAFGGTQILLQGGLHPHLDITWYENLLKFIKNNYSIWVHGFSPPEIAHIADISNLSEESVLNRLLLAGLDSMPGGGAEILDDEVRRLISPNKILSSRWLNIMEIAHKLGMKTTATMMFRKNERAESFIKHFFSIRDLQDKTGGFTAFIPWPFQPGNSELSGASTTPLEYLRILAASRIILDNIPNIQVSWVTQGDKTAQLGLFFGANDFGSVMMEENVVRAAGVNFRMQEEEIRNLISEAGFNPKVRNMLYEIIS